MNTSPKWQPGDPLHLRGSYTNYGTFNFREDHDGPEPGPDAASWPEPVPRRRLIDIDELGMFIEHHRAWQAEQDGAA